MITTRYLLLETVCYIRTAFIKHQHRAMSSDSRMETLRAMRQKAEGSTRLVLGIVFFTNFLDNLLLTSVGTSLPVVKR